MLRSLNTLKNLEREASLKQEVALRDRRRVQEEEAGMRKLEELRLHRDELVKELQAAEKGSAAFSRSFPCRILP